MSFRTTLTGAVLALLGTGAFAGEIEILDPYARSSRPNAPTGAVFMLLLNHAETADRLVSAASDVAQKVELHTHEAGDNGVMKMRAIEGGLEIPAGGHHALARGGDHVMLMGLKQPLQTGETITVTLTFENAGEITVEVPVDPHRKPASHGGHGSDG